MEYKVKDIVEINGLQYYITYAYFLMPIGADCKKIDCQECKFNFSGKGLCAACLRSFNSIKELNKWIKENIEDKKEEKC